MGRRERVWKVSTTEMQICDKSEDEVVESEEEERGRRYRGKKK